MLAFLLALAAAPPATAAATAHPLCPYREPAALKRMAPSLKNRAEELAEIFADYEARFGRCQKAEERGTELTLHFAEAELPLKLELDGKRRWTALGFGTPRYPDDSFVKVERALKDERFSLFVQQEGRPPVHARRADEALSVGESVQLLWLAAYRAAVRDGQVKPTDTVALKPESAAFSPGPLSHWPAGVPLTLESTAQLAFRSRDNVAGDLLLEGLGRRAGGQRWFTYGELYRLMLLPEQEGRARLAKGPPLGAVTLPQSPARPPEGATPLAPELGWRVPTRALCAAALQLKEDAVFTGDQAPPEGWLTWLEVSGEFPRTLNLTRFGRRNETDPWVCASLTLENPSENSYVRGRDALERALLLGAGAPGSPGKEP